jgi:hypothetical protein
LLDDDDELDTRDDDEVLAERLELELLEPDDPDFPKRA